MATSFILASGSSIRSKLLNNAGIKHDAVLPRVDEEMVKQAMQAEGAPPRDIADKLAELKARKISEKHPGSLVLGCDQVLDHAGVLLSKPKTHDDAIAQLRGMRGDRHSLFSAGVICENGQPIWRHVGQVRLRMRDVSDAYIDDYVSRNWDSIQHSVGAYKLEEEGVRLFTSMQGDYFHVLGMPLLELINYLTLRGDLSS